MSHHMTVFRTVSYITSKGIVSHVVTYCGQCDADFPWVDWPKIDQAERCPKCGRWITVRQAFDMPIIPRENKKNGDLAAQTRAIDPPSGAL